MVAAAAAAVAGAACIATTSNLIARPGHSYPGLDLYYFKRSGVVAGESSALGFYRGKRLKLRLFSDPRELCYYTVVHCTVHDCNYATMPA